MARTAAKLLSAALFAMLSTGLVAAPATVEQSAKLRSTPSTGSRVIATLPRGTAVDVNGCSSGWCKVAAGRRRGYVAQTLLALSGGPAPTAAVPAPAYQYDYPGFDFPGATVGPAVITVTPRWSHRRWTRARYQPRSRAWRVYPAAIAPGPIGAERSTLGRTGVAPVGAAPPAVPVDAARPTVGSMPQSGRGIVPATPTPSSPLVPPPTVPSFREAR